MRRRRSPVLAAVLGVWEQCSSGDKSAIQLFRNQALHFRPLFWLYGGMERIHYAGHTVITGTDISRALLAYAHALALDGTSATVDIPILDAEGDRGTAEFLIGPASQLVSESVHSEGEELIDPATVQKLERATRGLGGPRAEPVPLTDENKNLEFPDFGEV